MHEKYDPGTYLVLANVLIPRDCDTAEKILRDGMKQFPSAAGFHLLLGHVHQSRGHHAEAFYEYQWELLRTGAARTEGADAARRCAELVKKPSSSRELADLMTTVQEMQRNPQLASEMLAEMIGATRSRVSFFMNRFRKLGFIEYNGSLRIHSSLLNVVLHD